MDVVYEMDGVEYGDLKRNKNDLWQTVSFQYHNFFF